MIRFGCPGCQKVLCAPEDKAGLQLACPQCKTPFIIPGVVQAVTSRPQQPTAVKPLVPPTAASSSISAPSAAPKSPLVKRMLGELIAILFATVRQTLKPITLIFETHRRNRLRKKAGEAQFALGQRLYETKQGDKNLHARIQVLGERIHGIQDVRGDAREQIAERRGLILQLAEPALISKAAPRGAEGEHQRARLGRAQFQAKEKTLAGAFGGLMPAGGVAWRRILIGYPLALLLAFGGWKIYGWAAGGSHQAEERAAHELAEKQAADKKRQEDDARWAGVKDTEQIVEVCGPSVALIRFKVGKYEGGGTGFMIRPGILATNAHVINNVLPEDLKVYYPSAKDLAKTPFPARVLYIDGKRDLAFLAVEPKVPPLRLADNFEFKSGKNITVIGCPGVGPKQLENAVNTGVLSTKIDVEKMPFFQLGISVNPGNSGGPVFDNHGQVIGVVTLKASQESIAFCIPWQDLKDRVDSLEKDDPHRIAAAAQSMHSLHVVLFRVSVSSAVYAKIMAINAAAMREATAKGRPASDGLAKARPIESAILSNMAPFKVDDKYKALALKLLADVNLPADVRAKFSDLWKTYEELKRNVESPTGTAAIYSNLATQLETRFKNNWDALGSSLGLEPPKFTDDDGSGS